ncbi:Rv2629 family ribosome hibernation factor [Pseudonocardia adelaidensis]|uniref:Peptide subunit release factor 1 (ERF1) n=1 Tax=Pseudonocardia adelaidensis TaxID=648754 RepID=A0ABP9NIG2_9PSEU
MDLRFLNELTKHVGPFATVYLDTSHDTDDAARAIALRWADARERLASEGADAGTLDALETAVESAPPAVGRAGRVLVARGSRVVLDRALPEPPVLPEAHWGPLPDLLPALVDQPEPVTAVVVRVDETGGEILLAGPDARPVVTEQVEGREHPVHKVRSGGWSHLAMQERVEESWRRNTAQVAERVDRHVADAGASVLLVAGDPRARSRLIDALGERSASIVVQLEGGGAGGDDLAAAVAEALRDVVTSTRLAVLDRYEKAAGRGDGLAVQGVGPVLAALRAEAVDTLLLDAGVHRDGTVWISREPAQVAEAPADLRVAGSDPTAEVPVDAAMLRAAAGSGAGFVPIGGGRTGLVRRPLDDGVGALLRYPLPAGA